MMRQKREATSAPPSKMYNGETYWLHRRYDTKREAKTVALGLRRLGWNARVERVRLGWGVYRCHGAYRCHKLAYGKRG